MQAQAEQSLDRMRVDNLGSMLRPQTLKQAFARHQKGEISDGELRQAQDDAIRNLVAHQERRNLPIIVDGEFRRTIFMESFAEVLGFDEWGTRLAKARTSRSLADTDQEKANAPSSMALTPATEPLQLRRNRPLAEYEFAQELTKRPVKTTLIGPDRIFQAYDSGRSVGVYDESQLFLDDVVRVEREIVSGLRDAGCRYVHIDAPGYTAYVDPASQEKFRSRGLDREKMIRQTIDAENAVIADFPGVTFGIHICRGNERSHWHREGTYDAIAEQLFSGLEHQRLLLEYDSERAGSFAPLRFVPNGKTVVLGLISTKVGVLETRDELHRRIDDAARYVPIEQLAISTQCGFASSIEGNNLTETDQWAKLDLVLGVASEIWGDQG